MTHLLCLPVSDIFSVYDQDNDGYLTHSEVLSVLKMVSAPRANCKPGGTHDYHQCAHDVRLRLLIDANRFIS